jgi:hypothetical protein
MSIEAATEETSHDAPDTATRGFFTPVKARVAEAMAAVCKNPRMICLQIF